MKRKNLDTYKKILSYLKSYAFLITAVIILAAASVALTLCVPIFVGDAVDFIVGKGQVNFKPIISILFRTGVIIAVTSLINWIMNILNNKIVYGVLKDIRERAFSHLQILPLSYADTHPHGDTVSRIISDADAFADGLLMGFTQLFTGVMTILLTIAFMLAINLKIAFLVIVLTPISLLVSRFIASRTYELFTVQSETRGEQTAMIQEYVSNQKVVQAFSRGGAAMEEFDEINSRLEGCSVKAIFFSSLVNPSTRFVNSLVYALVALGGAMLVVSGGLTVGGLTCFLSYANQYTKPFNEISGVIAELQNSLACAARLFELMEEEPQSADGSEVFNAEEAEGAVAAHNVSFSYTPERPLIKNLNLDIKPGQQTAIVGPTGCGKTTFINLLMRFYDVCGGEIKIDGTNINSFTRKSVRSAFGMVLQDTWLKSGTIRENIAIAKEDATDEEIVNAAKSAYAHGFIRRLPKGYDTYITNNGQGLSQGEKQLLCIARLMLCRPPMLILDEATSSIDTRTEVKIQNAFASLMKGRTSFIVAHRLSTIKNSDLILVMKDGDIVEQGTHDSLMSENGFYARIYNSSGM